jgi:AbrB family looped-hinge helix DNA binding protein
MQISTMTSKGQVTIPKEIRDRLQLRVGQRLEFQVDSRKQLVVTPKIRDIRALRGTVRNPRRKAVTVRQMNKAIADGYGDAGQ